jgi:Zn-dependent protease with chaperone function
MVLAIILVSRIFEKQADAYAAVALSAASGSDSVTPEGASALASALGAIAQTQCINPSRKDLLHGSITSRQRDIQALVGCSFSGIPINKQVFFLKIGLVVFFLLGILI